MTNVIPSIDIRDISYTTVTRTVIHTIKSNVAVAELFQDVTTHINIVE